MSHHSSKQIQSSIRDWVSLDNFACPFAVTLTLKQRIDAQNGMHKSAVWLTPELASQNLRHFLNVLNKRIHGSSGKRYGRQVPVLAVLEGGQAKRLHYHLLIDCPRDDLIETFPQLVSETWHSTQWGYDQVEVTQADFGWVDYITKLRDKPDFDLAIDWMNCTDLAPATVARDRWV